MAVYFKNFTIVGLVLLCMVMSSCVSKKKYQELDATRTACENREQDLKKQLSDLEAMVAELEKANKEAQAQLSDTSSKLTETNTLLDDTSKARLQLDRDLKEKETRLNEREATIKDLHALIERQKNIVISLLNKIKRALVQYDSSELSVEIKNGKVYVAMSDKLLFRSGSTRVDKNGKEALQQLAQVLVNQPGIEIMIEGHTDNVPIIKSPTFKDNWDLSVIRATEVVRILTEEFNLDKTTLIPCGRGEFLPKADNETPEGRAVNRRTEIILYPNLDELYKLLNM